MTKEIEILIKKIALRDVEIALLEAISQGLFLDSKKISEILNTIETNYN